jgi:hypothetical protein
VATFRAVIVLAASAVPRKPERVVGDDVLIFGDDPVAQWIAWEMAGGISPDDLCDRWVGCTARRLAQVCEPRAHPGGIVGQPMGRHRPNDERCIAQPMPLVQRNGRAAYEFVMHIRDQLRCVYGRQTRDHEFGSTAGGEADGVGERVVVGVETHRNDAEAVTADLVGDTVAVR